MNSVNICCFVMVILFLLYARFYGNMGRIGGNKNDLEDSSFHMAG